MPPIIHSERCNACGICADFCPTDVFRKNEKGRIPEVKNPEECWHCNACVLDCKQGAVELRIPLSFMILYTEV